LIPSLNLDHPDPTLPALDHVLGEPRAAHVEYAMNNNAFGGINTSLIFKAVS
jgi:3-oxoacyl-(acyl-carrier-protein) synthase